jgi:hypothetical protein
MIAYIYIIKSKNSPKVYIGSTIQTLENRFKGHKNSKKVQSKYVIEQGDSTIELLEEVECIFKADLREWYWIMQYIQTCVNIRLPTGLKGKIPEWRGNLVEYYREMK